jgi:hypothetical protein
VPAFTFPQSGRDSAKRVFISKLHSKSTGESISGAPEKIAARRVVLAGLRDPWPSVLIWVSAMSSGTGAVQLQPRLFEWATRRCKQRTPVSAARLEILARPECDARDR